jgi:BNR/Asp-box repeat.
MNTRLRLIILAAVFALLTPATSMLHAQVLAPTEGIDTRKCIKPKDRAPKPTDLFAPLTCLEAVVNVSATADNQAESFVNVNPTNTNNLVAFSNLPPGVGSIFRAYSTDGGTNWTRGTIATGVACCDGQAAWDTFGNLFLVYINDGADQINVILSTDGGVTFSAPVTVGTGMVDQPSIAVGIGSVWVDWRDSFQSIVARGAPVTGLGVWGPFNAEQEVPSTTGNFGGIAVGPGPGGGKVIVTYQSPFSNAGPSTIYANVDADGLGVGGFGPQITVSDTNVGGFLQIPAQPGSHGIDAEAGVVWDATGGQFNNRIYLVYTDRITLNTNDTDIWMRTSTDDGTTWSAPVRVNDDATTNSQFLPYVALDPTTGTVGVSFHDCRNDDGVNGTNNIPNDDAEYYGTFSTDGGVTWAPNTRLSGGFSNATDSGNGIDYGDYVGSSALAGKLYMAWADNANCDGTNPDGTLHQFDLYANPLMLPGGTPTPTPRATPRPRPTPHPRPTPPPRP